ncbi:ShlB/FhaC/HecB family hemolysin secretion/activation protein [Cyanobium sp. HWJ4-Hawea]|nr:ShlB/FhaC/HecB family hemolysin secretion/activation protein [Cyanobium sp. HWJ4-Hawea]
MRLPTSIPIERPQAQTIPNSLQLSPELKKSQLISPQLLQKQIERCQQNLDQEPAQLIKDCASRLTAQLVAKGYINSRVIVDPLSKSPRLELVEGRLVELRVQSTDANLAKRTRRLLAPLQRAALQLPKLEAALQRLRQRPDVAAVRGNLGRLGSDPAKAVLILSVEPAAQPIKGELSLRNDGNSGTGEARALLTLSKSSLVQSNDQLLVYGEIDSDQDLEVGYLLGSISYTANINDQLNITGAFGSSRRNLVELSGLYHDLSYQQLQGYGQLNWTFVDELAQQWFAFAGLSLNRNDVFLNGDAVPLIIGGGESGWLRTGFVKVGVGFRGSSQSLAWAGQIYGLQGIPAFSTHSQQRELAEVGVNPGNARALGGSLLSQWTPWSQLTLTGRAAGQLSLNSLTSDMGFTLGSDSGLRGLPGQLVSGDNGYLGSLELAYNLWSNAKQRLQLVPFIGAGGVQSYRNSLSFSDTAGAGGVLLRWLHTDRWSVEIGWVNPFLTENQPLWNDWILSKGLYSQLKLRF